MRIIGGTAAGTILKVPDGWGVRPTPDRVRQAIFNSLGPRVVEARVLELFGGTGALGLECLSRGADSVLCIEKSAKHAGFIKRNARTAGLDLARFQIRVADVFQMLPRLAAEAQSFDLALADPPFGEKTAHGRSRSMSQQLLDDASLPSLLAGEGLFVLGHARRDEITVTAAWDEVNVLKHGDSVVRFLVPVSRPAQSASVREIPE